jgi:hypothetical protein
MKISGGCHCGKISYSADADPRKTVICHCSDCQVMSGTAFRTIIFVPDHEFNLENGKLKNYIKTADSGNRRVMAFCENCGSHIYATDVGDAPKVLGIRLGTCDQRADIKPVQQYYCSSKMAWVDEIDSIAVLER